MNSLPFFVNIDFTSINMLNYMLFYLLNHKLNFEAMVSELNTDRYIYFANNTCE